MITFFFSPLYDAILLVGCFVLIRKFILKKDLSANERFFFQHTSSFIYIPSFILCRTFDYCFSCEYTKVIY